jgi:hypothetical protein
LEIEAAPDSNNISAKDRFAGNLGYIVSDLRESKTMGSKFQLRGGAPGKPVRCDLALLPHFTSLFYQPHPTRMSKAGVRF